MNRTLIKKIVGTAGAIVGIVSAFLLDPKDHAALVAVFPHYGTQIALTTAILSYAATLWGKHPGSSPSVSDALQDGHLAVERLRPNVNG